MPSVLLTRAAGNSHRSLNRGSSGRPTGAPPRPRARSGGSDRDGAVVVVSGPARRRRHDHEAGAGSLARSLPTRCLSRRKQAAGPAPLSEAPAHPRNCRRCNRLWPPLDLSPGPSLLPSPSSSPSPGSSLAHTRRSLAQTKEACLGCWERCPARERRACRPVRLSGKPAQAGGRSVGSLRCLPNVDLPGPPRPGGDGATVGG
jgi:hypothetical protein